jgi:MFS family permease
MEKSAVSNKFYGWKIVSSTFVILFFAGGFGFYCFSVFVKPLAEAFGWSRTAISGSVAGWAVVVGITGPIIGYCIQRFGAKKTMGIAVIFASIAYLLLAGMTSLWMLYAIMLLLGASLSGHTMIPAQTLVTNWFDRLRGRAMALTMIGIGFGGLIWPPIVNAVIERFGWRIGFMTGSVLLIVIVLPIILKYTRTKPSEMGQRPDGEQERQGETPPPAATGISVKRVLSLPEFYLISSIYILHMFGQSMMTLHLVAFVDDTGYSSQVAANFWGLAVGISIGGRLLAGWLCDRWKLRYLLALGGLFISCSVGALEVFLIRLGYTSTGPLFLFSLFYGLGIAGTHIVIPVIVGRCFGQLNYGRIMGMVMSGFALGVIFGPTVAGRIFDTTGSYELAFVICIAGLVLSALLALLIRPERLQPLFTTQDQSRP